MCLLDSVGGRRATHRRITQDFAPLQADLRRCGVFHGTLCRHYVPPNTSTKTRVSLDFRIGVEGCFDPLWVLRGTLDDHNRREVIL